MKKLLLNANYIHHIIRYVVEMGGIEPSSVPLVVGYVELMLS